MQRKVALFLAMLMMFSVLTACSGTTAPAPATPAPPVSTQGPTQSVAPVQSATPTEEPLNYPTGPITMIIPAAAGGGVDTSSRIMASYLAEELGVTIMPENHPGASGIPGLNTLLQRPDDGYTIGLCSIAYSPWVAKTMSPDVIPWDPDESFYILACYNEGPAMSGFYCNSNKPWQTFDELIRAIQAAPPKSFNIGINGPGTTTDPAVLQFQELFDIELNVIYYPGSADTQSAMLTGDIDFGIGAVNRPDMLENPNYRILCLQGTHDMIPADWPIKTPLLDDFQDELGFDIEDANFMTMPTGGTWLMVRKGVDQRICDLLIEKMRNVVAHPEFQEKIKALGSYPRFMDPEESLKRHVDVANAMQVWLDTQP